MPVIPSRESRDSSSYYSEVPCLIVRTTAQNLSVFLKISEGPSGPSNRHPTRKYTKSLLNLGFLLSHLRHGEEVSEVSSPKLQLLSPVWTTLHLVQSENPRGLPERILGPHYQGLELLRGSLLVPDLLVGDDLDQTRVGSGTRRAEGSTGCSKDELMVVGVLRMPPN